MISPTTMFQDVPEESGSDIWIVAPLPMPSLNAHLCPLLPFTKFADKALIFLLALPQRVHNLCSRDFRQLQGQDNLPDN